MKRIVPFAGWAALFLLFSALFFYIAVPHEKWGEVPKAFVTLKADVTATEEELMEFCREHLAGYKIPRTVIFGPLPKTSTGKVQKFKLRERAAALE